MSKIATFNIYIYTYNILQLSHANKYVVINKQTNK